MHFALEDSHVQHKCTSDVQHFGHSLCLNLLRPSSHTRTPCTTDSSPYFDSSTLFVSSSWSNSPRFLIVPTLGSFSLGCWVIALRYACCKALVLAACKTQQLASICIHEVFRVHWAKEGRRGLAHLFLVVQALIIILQYRHALLGA